MALTEAVIAG